MFSLVPLLLQVAIAEPVVRTGTEGLMGGGNTVEFMVLDVNAKFAALRHVYTENDEEHRPVECRYPGLAEHPTAGVELALMELRSGDVTTFPVYRTAHSGGGDDQPRSCTSRKESKRQLSAAKQAFKQAGLNPERTPKPALSYVVERGERGVPHEDSVVARGVDLHDDGSETHVWSLPLHWKEHPLEIRYTERRESMGTTIAALADDEQVFYRATRTYELMQAGNGDVSFSQGYQTAEGMVFLEVFHSFTATQDAGHSYMYGLTPPIPEWSPWIELAFELVPNRVTEPTPQQVTVLVGAPGAPPTRVELGAMDGECVPSSSTTPISLRLSCGLVGASVGIVVRQDGDRIVVERYRSRTAGEKEAPAPERLREIPIPPGAHIRALLGN